MNKKEKEEKNAQRLELIFLHNKKLYYNLIY
jgi:hypothetical protein